MEFIKSKLEPLEITIDGVKYPAKLNFKALAELEELSKCSFLTIFDRFGDGVAYTTDILNVIYVSLKHAGVKIEINDIYEHDFTKEFLQDVMKEIGELMKRTYKVVSVIEAAKESGHASKK